MAGANWPDRRRPQSEKQANIRTHFTPSHLAAPGPTDACLTIGARFARPPVTLRFAPLVATLLLALARLDAADAPLPQITSQQPARITEKESVFSGAARLAFKDIVLYADEIAYRNAERVAVA